MDVGSHSKLNISKYGCGRNIIGLQCKRYRSGPRDSVSIIEGMDGDDHCKCSEWRYTKIQFSVRIGEERGKTTIVNTDQGIVRNILMAETLDSCCTDGVEVDISYIHHDQFMHALTFV